MPYKNNELPINEALDFNSIIDLISDTGGTLLDKSLNRTRAFRNISRATADLILTFPVIVEESVPLASANLITKAVEQNAVSMLQILFSAIMVTNNKDAFDFVSKVHQNLSSDDIEEVMFRMGNRLDRWDESVELEVAPHVYDLINESNKLADDTNYFNTEYPLSLNEQFEVFTEAKKDKNDKDKDKDDKGKKVKDKNDKESFRRRQHLNTPEVINSDVKKANEMQPTMMQINFRGPEEENGEVYSAIIGVKAKLQYVTTADMMDRIRAKNRDRHGLFELIRATTREIAFVKDFLLAVDRAKIDTINSGRTSSPIWKVLERRALRGKITRFIGFNDAAAISSLLISTDTLEGLKKDFDIDLRRPNVLLEIMNAYNIMAFFIDDAVNEKVTYIYDNGTKEFTTLPYKALERDTHNDLKKVINLLAASR